MKLPPWAAQATTFVGIGTVAFALDAGILWLTLAAGVSPYAGRVLSIAVTIVFTWWFNRRLTFRATAPASWREFWAYTLQSLLGAVINYAIYSAVIAAGAPILVGLVLGTGVASVFNFFRYRAILG